MTNNKSERSISRENLEKHGIYYNDKGSSILPAHVRVVRDMLLSFEHIIPDGGWKETLRKEESEYDLKDVWDEARHPPDTAWVHMEAYEVNLPTKSPQWNKANEDTISCQMVAKKAQGLREDAEDGWMHFWRTSTFHRVSEKVRDQPGFHPVLDKWSLDGNYEWNAFPSLEPNHSNNNDLCKHPRTRPKPDLTYAFPISRGPIHSLSAFERDDFCTSFSIESLGRLRKKGVICAPTTGLQKWVSSPTSAYLGSNDLTCFPWAVVECKKEEQGSTITLTKRCYCQAANASAAALDFRAQLCAEVMHDGYSRLPPVISFTCVGPVVKVWLTYYEEPNLGGKRKISMVCIWSTSVQLTWGVAALRALIMNMHTWASRLLKPKLQAWVLEALQKEEESPVRSSEIPGTKPALQGLFSSPQDNAASASKPPPSAMTPSALRDMDHSPCNLRRTSNTTKVQPVTPSLRGQATTLLATPPPKRTTASSIPADIVCPSTATPTLATGLPKVKSSTSVKPQIRNCTSSQKARSASKSRASADADMDHITMSLTSATLRERASLFGSGIRSPTTKVTKLQEALSSKDNTSPKSRSAESKQPDSDVLAQQASRIAHASLFKQTASGSQTTTTSTLDSVPFSWKPATSSTSSGGLSGSQTTTTSTFASEPFLWKPATSSTSSGGLFGSQTTTTLTFDSALFEWKPDISSMSGSGLFRGPQPKGDSLLGSNISPSMRSSPSSLFGKIHGADVSQQSSPSKGVTTSKSGSQLFGGTTSSKQEDSNAKDPGFLGFGGIHQSKLEIQERSTFEHCPNITVSEEHDGKSKDEFGSGSETAHDAEEHQSDSASHSSDEDENSAVHSSYEDEASAAHSSYEDEDTASSSGNKDEKDTSISGDEETSDIASEPSVDESESEAETYHDAHSTRSNASYLSGTDQGLDDRHVFKKSLRTRSRPLFMNPFYSP